MCGHGSGSATFATGEVAGPATGRRRLWEIDGGLHCSIVGTSASHDDLMRIARKLDVRLPRSRAAAVSGARGIRSCRPRAP